MLDLLPPPSLKGIISYPTMVKWIQICDLTSNKWSDPYYTLC